jgi:hypothetical protein
LQGTPKAHSEGEKLERNSIRVRESFPESHAMEGLTESNDGPILVGGAVRNLRHFEKPSVSSHFEFSVRLKDVPAAVRLLRHSAQESSWMATCSSRAGCRS